MSMEIFQFDFMARAFAAGAVVAVITPLIGSFLVLRRYSLMADTLAHTALAGVVAGILLRVSPLAGALIISSVAALGMDRLRVGGKIFGESVLAIFLSGSLAIVAVLVSAIHGFNAGFFNFLFGSIATVRPYDLYLMFGVGMVSVGVIIIWFRELFMISFDEELAEASGIRTRALNATVMLIAATTVSLAMQIVGALLVGALMVIPFISAMQFRRGFRETLLLSIVFSLISVFSGLVLAYYFDLASGGAIVIVALALFLISLFLRPKH